jgi:hypothetical protein
LAGAVDQFHTMSTFLVGGGPEQWVALLLVLMSNWSGATLLQSIPHAAGGDIPDDS